jgi:hypothetical protein
MNSIANFIGGMFAIAGIFVLTCIIAAFLFAMSWMQGVLQIFHSLGLDQFVDALPLQSDVAGNYVMWGIALFASLAVVGLSIKLIEALQNSLMNVVGCLVMFCVIVLPVYHYAYMSNASTPSVTVLEDIKASVQDIDIKVNIPVEL